MIRRKHIDRRPHAIFMAFSGVAFIGLTIFMAPQEHIPIEGIERTKSFTNPASPPMLIESLSGEVKFVRTIDPKTDPAGHSAELRGHVISRLFDQGVFALRQGQPEEAIKQFHKILEIEPQMASAHMNVGFALFALNKPLLASQFFQGAIEINPAMAGPYFGLAESFEDRGDLESALGAMRSYLHLARSDPEKKIENGGREELFVARARSAIWEWESTLERGPWGKPKVSHGG